MLNEICQEDGSRTGERMRTDGIIFAKVHANGPSELTHCSFRLREPENVRHMI